MASVIERDVSPEGALWVSLSKRVPRNNAWNHRGVGLGRAGSPERVGLLSYKLW